MASSAKSSYLSSIDICNMALSFLGQSRFISSMSEASVEARVCDLHYKNVLKGMLEEYPWQFAFEVDKLSELSLPEANPQWSYAYAMPQGCLRIRKVATSDDFEGYGEPFTTGHSVYGKAIFTNVADAYGAYTAYIDDPTMFPPLFVEAFAYKLAIAIVPALTAGGTQIRESLINYYMKALSDAKMSDGNECFREAPEWATDYLDARGTGYSLGVDLSELMRDD